MRSREPGGVVRTSLAEVRPYRSEDADATLAVFLDAVHVTASPDYSAEQVASWARPAQRRIAEWDRSMTERNSIVAVIDDEIAGFSDVSTDGYIDMMFVAPKFARTGVATVLLSSIDARARAAGSVGLTANVSITARQFFEKHQFIVEAEQHPIIEGVELINYRMTKALD